jgi:2-polyprenyl-3-methyl-5-hydroxy-6-metoxy-1,4-benzoquinol methylase
LEVILSFYNFKNKNKINRVNKCVLCGEKKANLVGKINYFNLQEYNMLQCSTCGLVNADPLPDIETIKNGYSMLYSYEKSLETRKSILRGFGRSFRRGKVFARNYLKKLNVKDDINILEIGAGNGYFSVGIKQHYPNAKITYIEFLKDLVKFYDEHHKEESICGEFSSEIFKNRKFDIIIFRQLIEHLVDPLSFLKEVNKVLSKNGIVFLTLSSGRTDFWLINQKFIKTNKSTNLIVNHFNYFLPETLDFLLKKAKFSKKIAFKYNLKAWKKGLGHKEFNSFKENYIPNVEINKKNSLSVLWKHNPSYITKKLLNRDNLLSLIYSCLNIDKEKRIVNYYEDKGDEFFIIAEKNNN